jgi:thioredoxin 2
MNTTQIDDRGLVQACPECGQRNRMTYERLGQTFRCGKCQTVLSGPGTPVEVNTEPIFDAILGRSALPVLVDFWAEWCGPCKMVAPELAKVASDSKDRCLILKVDTEALPGLASRFRITGIPTLALFKHGREAARKSGAMPAAMIRRFIETN